MALFYYINETDRTSDVTAETLRLDNQIQQRTDSCIFQMHAGNKPSENQDLKIYDGATVSSVAGADITINDNYTSNINTFRAGQELFVRIGDADEEKVTIDSFDSSTNVITLTSAPSGTVSAGDQIGEIIFGGIVARIKDKNIHSLSNLEWIIIGIDYTKIFDKKIISDSWQDKDARYIINSFVNGVVNYNQEIDDLDYNDNTAIQTEITEGGDGSNPTIDASDYIEGDASGVFAWINSGGTATWDWTPNSQDISDFIGVSSGNPTEGRLMFWIKTSNQSDITSLKIQIGSDASNYGEFTINLTPSQDWQYTETKFTDASITGTPDWTAVDTAQINITETGNGQIKLNGLRVNAENSFTLFNVKSTTELTDFRSPQLKPTAVIQLLAKTFEYFWYIDYERDIHFADIETEVTPYDLTETSENFYDLQYEVDVSNLGNRIIINGGEKTSEGTYAEVKEGDNTRSEWILKAKFKNLAITIDNNSSTDTMEAGTTTTTINATSHGLSIGDHIVNRSRSNAVRQVLTVPSADQFTVKTVTGQTSGDTFSLFSVSKTDGIEGITNETTVDYVANSNEKSVRATESEDVLTTGNFIRFAYNERVPIQLRYTNPTSVNALKALGIGDGIIDLDPITDRNIQDDDSALVIAQAKTTEFSNAIINGSFQTDQKGLHAGQVIKITDTTRGIDDEYVIQKVSAKQQSSAHHDYLDYTITFGTTLFGWIEFMQKLLRTKDAIEQNVDDIPIKIVDAQEEVGSSDSNQTATNGGFLTSANMETVESSDSNTVVNFTPPWKWEPNGVGQPLNTRWNLFSWD